MERYEPLIIERLYEKGMEALQKTYNILKQIPEHPELILTDLYVPGRQPYYRAGFSVFNKNRELIDEGFSHHDLQRYVFKLLNRWVMEIDPDLYLKRTNDNQFPTTFDLILKGADIKVLTFSIYFHEYTLVTSEVKRLTDNIAYLEEDLQKDQKELTDLKAIVENPRALLKDFRDYWTLLIHPHALKKAINRLKKKIDRLEKSVKREEDVIERNKRQLDKLLAHQEQVANIQARWSQKLQQAGYTEQEVIWE